MRMHDIAQSTSVR